MIFRFFFAISLLILLTTFSYNEEISINTFKIKDIKIENNNFLKKKDLLKEFSFLYERNLFLLNDLDIEKKVNNSFIESLNIKKIYPNIIKIRVYEKQPRAIIIFGDSKFFLGEKFELIKFEENLQFKNLPVVYGDNKSFKTLFNELQTIKFPTEQIKYYHYFNAKRWDLEMIDNKKVRLPSKNYLKSLQNFLEIKKDNSFNKYKIFDYRLKNQLILK